jgi:phosphatidylserine decarboxylase
MPQPVSAPIVSMSDRLSVLPQYLVPKQALTALMGALARRQGGTLTTAVIKWFIGRYGVNMAEADDPRPEAYASFNDFFTRPLKPSARPIETATWVSPVDGAISQLGPLTWDDEEGHGPDGDMLVQAKGRYYSTTDLLCGDTQAAERFDGGHFATLYLSPKDYHRIHMPCDGTLTRMVYVPGDLFSVNPTTARVVPRLFARNERVVCHFDTPHGPFVLVLVGATIVGSMATVWHGVVNPPRPGRIQQWDYADATVRLRQGDEMGRFLLGSTVVMLWPASATLAFEAHWQPGGPIRMGEAMAKSRGA